MTDQSNRVFVLVHGSFHGAWAFEKLTPLLVQQGHQVIARDLPGHGLQARFPRSYLERQLDLKAFAAEPSPIAKIRLRDCADPIISSIRQVADRTPDRRIILVGHSVAGLVLNLVGETLPHIVDRLVYLSAFMPANGKTADDYLTAPEFAASPLLSLPVADPSATGAYRINPRSVDPAYQAQLKATFAADLDDDDWTAVVNLLTPDTPAGPHAEPATHTTGRWGAIPRTYISSTADDCFPLAVQRRFIREADAFTPDNRTHVREMTTSHSPFWSQPEQLARTLLELST